MLIDRALLTPIQHIETLVKKKGIGNIANHSYDSISELLSAEGNYHHPHQFCASFFQESWGKMDRCLFHGESFNRKCEL